MASLLYRLGKTAFRRWPVFVAAWLVVLLAVGVFAGDPVEADDRRVLHPGHPVRGGRRPPVRAVPRIGDAFDQATVNVVVEAPAGHTLSEPEYSESRR